MFNITEENATNFPSFKMTVDQHARLIIYSEPHFCDVPASYIPFESDCPFITFHKEDAKQILDWMLAYEAKNAAPNVTDVEIFGAETALSYERLVDHVQEGVYQTLKPADPEHNYMYLIARTDTEQIRPGEIRSAVISAKYFMEAFGIFTTKADLGDWVYDPTKLSYEVLGESSKASGIIMTDFYEA